MNVLAQEAGESAGAIGLILIVAAIALYLLPTIVAHRRKAMNRGSVTVINILLGWTLLGWVISLAMAMGRSEAQEAALHRPQMAPGQTMAAGWYPDPEDRAYVRWWDGFQWNMGPDGRRQVRAEPPPSPRWQEAADAGERFRTPPERPPQ